MHIEAHVSKQNVHQSERLSHYDGGKFDLDRYILSLVNGEEYYEIIQAEISRLPIFIESIREETIFTIRVKKCVCRSNNGTKTMAPRIGPFSI